MASAAYQESVARADRGFQSRQWPHEDIPVPLSGLYDRTMRLAEQIIAEPKRVIERVWLFPRICQYVKRRKRLRNGNRCSVNIRLRRFV